MTDELCRHADDPDRWFPKPTEQLVALDAKRVCWQCPAREPCAAEGLANPNLAGIWGGLSEGNRRQIRAGTTTERAVLDADQQRAATIDSHAATQANQPRELTPCGTHTAYQRHYRNGQPIDAHCLHAERIYQRNRKRKKRPDTAA